MKKVLFVVTFMVVGLGMMAQTLVYTPELKSPVDSATGQMPNVVLSWYAVAGSVNLQYQLQMDTTAAFNSPLLVDETLTLLTGYQTTNLFFNTMYYWRVRAIDGATSNWTGTWHFTVFDMVVPDKPHTADQDANVSLVWKNTIGSITISGVDQFDYQVDTSLNFDSPLLQEGNVAGTIVTVATHLLRFGADYHWRVRARHAVDISNWCEPLDFTVVDQVTLSSPTNNATDQVLDVVLKWKTLGGIMAFDYQIALDEGFTDLILNGFTVDLQVNADFTMFGMDYYWRVRARHQTDTTNWSETRMFTTINTVLLKSPTDGQSNVSVTPVLYWYAQTAITGYQLQIATDVDFTNIFWDVKPIVTESNITVTKKMASQTTYFWRMRAFSDGDETADTTEWSTPWSLTTGFPQAIGEQEGTSLRIYPNPANDRTVVTINAAKPSSATLSVMNLVGKTIFSKELVVTAGENTFPIVFNEIRNGLYIVRLTIGEETINQKLVVE